MFATRKDCWILRESRQIIENFFKEKFMFNIPKLQESDVQDKRVIVRLDFDVPEGDYSRIEASRETLDYLLQKNCKLRLIGHKGRPCGKKVEELSLKGVSQKVSEFLSREVLFSEDLEDKDADIVVFENLRFEEGEEANDEEFSKKLSLLGDFFVNEAFAVSHRAHASIVGIPKYLKHAAGIRFAQEIEHLLKIIENPERPLIFVISGLKEDKLEMIRDIKNYADKVLVGGKLPEYFGKSSVSDLIDEKLVVAELNPDKEDINLNSIERFVEEIQKAKTIVLAGVIGKYEDEGQRLGTRRVFEAVANSQSYKVAGGGDTEAALTIFGLTSKFDWISVGGGAMLEFLAKKTLPGIDALLA